MQKKKKKNHACGFLKFEHKRLHNIFSLLVNQVINLINAHSNPSTNMVYEELS